MAYRTIKTLLNSIDLLGPLSVGIDPSPEVLSYLKLKDCIDSVELFVNKSLDILINNVALIKFQVSFFERYGSIGIRILEQALQRVNSSNITLSCVDCKRCDIESSMEGYAQAYFNLNSPLFANMITVNPYFGFDNLSPLIKLINYDSSDELGIFIIASSSNMSQDCINIQNARISNISIVNTIINKVSNLNNIIKNGFVGIVLGNFNDNTLLLDNINYPVLIPGIVTQGQDIVSLYKRLFNINKWIVPHISRAIFVDGFSNIENNLHKFQDMIIPLKRS